MPQHQNEAYQEYFRKTKNKLSLAAWALLNNNIVTPSMYYTLLSFEFAINLVLVLCLYHTVGSMPALSESVLNLVDYSEANSMAVVSMSITGVMVAVIASICVLIFK